MTIREYLERTGISVRALSTQTGIAYALLYAWRDGKSFPSGKSLQKLVDGTGGAITAKDVLEVCASFAKQHGGEAA